MGLKMDPMKEELALIAAQQLLMVIARYGVVSSKKMIKWAKEILEYYPNQGVIEEVWKDRILEATVTRIAHKEDQQ